MKNLVLPTSLALILALTACQTDPQPPKVLKPPTPAEKPAKPKKPEVQAPPAKDPPKAALCTEAPSVVTLKTEDGIELKADLRPAARPDRGALILFHMIPPSNNRKGYPERVLKALNALDLTVLNVDRRGAGESKGNPREAYKGKGGRLDMEAAVRFLKDRQGPCKIDTTRITLIGASNGTTSVLDYTLSHDPTLPDPRALVLLSPGTYSEIQHPIKDHLDKLKALPILWIHPDKEPYSRRHTTNKSKIWSFLELKGGQHGTRNFDGGDLEKQQLGAIINFTKD